MQPKFPREPSTDSEVTQVKHFAQEKIPAVQYLRCKGCWPSERDCRRTPTAWLAFLPWKGCYSQAGWQAPQYLLPQHWWAGCSEPQGRRHHPGGSAWSGVPPRWTAEVGCTERLRKAGRDTCPARQRRASGHQLGGQDQTV